MTKYDAPSHMRVKLINWGNYIASMPPQSALIELAKFPRKEIYNFITKTPVVTFPETITRKDSNIPPESAPNSPPHSAASESVVEDTEESTAESTAETQEPAKKKRKKTKKV
jgi:hypothetical protein